MRAPQADALLCPPLPPMGVEAEAASAGHAGGPFDAGPPAALSATLAALAGTVGLLSYHGAAAALRAHLLDVGVFFALTLALMLLSVDAERRGSISVAGVTLLASGFTYGVGTAVFAGLGAAGVHALSRRSNPRKAVAAVATTALAAAAATEVYRALPHTSSPLFPVGPALAAGVVFWFVNVG